MGAAASRLRSASTAGKAFAIAALVFVAGTAGVLHHNNFSIAGFAAPPIGASNFPCGVGTIPLPRKVLRGGVDRARGIKCSSSNRRKKPRRSLPMPRGVVQHQTNLEMESSQTGNPERRKQLEEITPPRHPPRRVFWLCLLQWNDLDWSGRAVHVAAQGQTKWWFAKRFLHPDVVAEYEFIFLWDEDIEVDNFDPLRYLDVVKREGLEVSQPALDRRSEMHHAITARALMPASDVHRRAQGVRCENDNMGPPCMGWVEVMVPVFSQEAWRCVWHMVQNDLVHGWGLDFKVGYCAQGDRKQNVAVIDSEYVRHRGVPVLNDGSKATSPGRAATRWRAFKEMLMFNKRWQEASVEESWIDPYAAEPLTASST
ncbi:hypothetical protein QOZ80_7BG0595940 [Eleusine coracana subsp. coracana]|nr:hypothetical protein QOZ80_7BG0595940 [Eleusine coracana subsp. coracana]